MESLKQDVLTIDKNAIALEKGFCLMEEDFADVNKELELIQYCTENVDNLLRENNIRIKGLKVYTEGKDLKAYLEHYQD